MVMATALRKFVVLALLLPVTQSVQSISSLPVHKVPLRRSDPDSPFCYAVSCIADLRPHQNFLATQVWPSARAAAHFIQSHINPSWTVCELGCGPGLPSLAAAKVKCQKVIATDLDELALELVLAAAIEQGLTQVTTERVDLLKDYLPIADLYILSDVFESGSVAQGAAFLTKKALDRGARVWVFAQTDRAQREAYLAELEKLDRGTTWIPMEGYDGTSKLVLFDIDEQLVKYC
jgi:predicted nicotinamide N-methyase